jgi:hypothetical protein
VIFCGYHRYSKFIGRGKPFKLLIMQIFAKLIIYSPRAISMNHAMGG